MAYKTFIAGEEALASDVNSLLMSQTVARFATAAARASALTVPGLNQMTMLDSRPGAVQYWTGSAWADVVHLIQFVNGVYTTNVNGDAQATFPTPFSATPVVVVTHGEPSNLTCNLYEPPLTTSAGMAFYDHNGNKPVNGLVRIHWIAIGLRP
jgi:hypothetical protein